MLKEVPSASTGWEEVLRGAQQVQAGRGLQDGARCWGGAPRVFLRFTRVGGCWLPLVAG